MRFNFVTKFYVRYRSEEISPPATLCMKSQLRLFDLIVQFFSSLVGHTCSLRLGRTKCSCTNNSSGRMLCSKITSVTTTAIIATKTPRRTPETKRTRQDSQTPCPHIPRGQRYVLIIHFYVESGQKMIQFNIQFKIKSKIYSQ